MEYKVIEVSWLPDLERIVNQYLKENWQLQGGISITYKRGHDFNSMFYAQALIKN